MRSIAKVNFKWYQIDGSGSLTEASGERVSGYMEEMVSIDNSDGFDSEIEAVNALSKFCEHQYESDSYILIKSYKIRGDY